MKIYHNKAFTLAETLIALVILGIVAIIIITNLVQQYQKRLTITKLQKAYANIEKAAINLALSTDCIGSDFNCTDLSKITDVDEFQQKFFDLSGMDVQKLGRFKTYKRGAANFNCLNIDSTCTVGTNGILYNIDFYVTKDNLGYTVKKAYIKTFDQWGYFPNWTRKQKEETGIIIYVFLDPVKMNQKINNKKIGSIMGKDTFVFVLYGNFQVEPALMNSEGSICTMNAGNINDRCNKNNTGFGCAAKIVKDGWIINYW